MKSTSRSSLWVRGISVLLALSLVCLPAGCGEHIYEDTTLESFFNDKSGPPEPLPQDKANKAKTDAIVLPTISVTVWAVGALIVYIGAHEVFNNTIADFTTIMEMALGQEADWSWADEPLNQADHLTESLNRIAYRSVGSDFYSVNGNDYLLILSMLSPINIVDPAKLKDLMDGKVRPWGKYAKEYFAALQVASTQARHLKDEQTGEGLCARATVHSKTPPHSPFLGMARASGPIDVIPAAVFASLKATMRCGLYDSKVREFVYGYYSVGGPMDAIPDIFISHMLKSAKLLYKYVDACQMPPKIVIDMDGGDCYDVTVH